MSFAKEFLAFLGQRKKYWLIPVIVTTLVVGVLVVLGESSALAPFLYTLF